MSRGEMKVLEARLQAQTARAIRAEMLNLKVIDKLRKARMCEGDFDCSEFVMNMLGMIAEDMTEAQRQMDMDDRYVDILRKEVDTLD